MECARSGSKEDKLALAKNLKSLGSDKQDNICHILAKDSEAEVRLALLDFPYLIPSVWETLADTKDEAFKKKVLKHEKCPAEVKAKFTRSCGKCMYGGNRYSDNSYWCGFHNKREYAVCSFWTQKGATCQSCVHNKGQFNCMWSNLARPDYVCGRWVQKR